MYHDKPADYFSHARRDVAALLPTRADHALELGCGDGSTLAWLKQSGRARHTTGLELAHHAATQARPRIDTLIEGDLTQALPQLPAAHFDLVLCLDVLEHLADPWDALRQVHRLIHPQGRLIVSLPNVRHHSVLLPLIIRGRWHYEDAGILDRTHLRFFTRSAAHALLTNCGFTQGATHDTGLTPTRLREHWKPLVARTPLRDFAVFQFLLSAHPTP